MLRLAATAFPLILCAAMPSFGTSNNWIEKEKEIIEADIQKLKGDEAAAQAALSQAQDASQKSAALKDLSSAAISRQAEDAAEDAVAAARAGLTRLSAKIAAFNAAGKIPSARAVLGEHSGDISALIGGKWTAVDDQTEIRPGMRLKTGSQSQATLYFEDGSAVAMAPNSEFMLEAIADHGSVYRLLAGAVHGLLSKKLLEGQSVSYHLSNVVMTIRGTEFDLSVDRGGKIRLVPYSGVMELRSDGRKAQEMSPQTPRISAKGSTALPPGVLARIISSKGDVRIKTANGATRSAAADDTLAKGASLETGQDGSVSLALAEDLRAELGPGSQWQASVEGNTSRAIYALWRGLERVLGPASTDKMVHSSRFLTPNAVAETRGAEFEISVDAQGLSEVTPLAGAITVTARAERLDLDKIKPWWRQKP